MKKLTFLFIFLLLPFFVLASIYATPWKCDTYDLGENKFITQCSHDEINRWKFN